jgi:hypothetical protein
VMAIVGWIRGYKTQGTSRSIIQIDLDTLINKISMIVNYFCFFLYFSDRVVQRFIQPEIVADHSTDNVALLYVNCYGFCLFAFYLLIGC